MKIAVVNTWCPFARGGAEHLADALTANLNTRGHEAILVKIPFQWNPPSKVLDHIAACRSMRLEGADLMIGLKFPSYHLPHPNKVLWLLHQYRQVYDLWDAGQGGVEQTPFGESLRRMVMNSDEVLFNECRRIYTNSSVTGQRLKKYNGVLSEVLLPPLARPEIFRCSEYGDYIFCPSRITASKRQHVLVEAMALVKTGVRLVLAGLPESSEDLARLMKIIAAKRLEDRVQIIPRFISEDEKADLFASALASAYVPYDEDSYGYVSIESFLAKKPVVTFSDSGGVLAVVDDLVTGRVVAPTPHACAKAFDGLWSSRDDVALMGKAGHDKVRSLNLSWDHVVEALTS